MKFRVGQTIFRPSVGLCRIIGTKEITVEGTTEEYYIVVHKDTKLMMPRSRAEAGGLRKLMTDKEIEQIIEILSQPYLPEEEKEYDFEESKKIISGQNPWDLAQYLNYLHYTSNQKNLDRRESEMYKTALSLFGEEISFVRNISKAEANRIIKKALTASKENKKTTDEVKVEK